VLAASNLSGVDEWVWRLPLLTGTAECIGVSVSRMTAQMNLGEFGRDAIGELLAARRPCSISFRFKKF